MPTSTPTLRRRSLRNVHALSRGLSRPMRSSSRISSTRHVACRTSRSNRAVRSSRRCASRSARRSSAATSARTSVPGTGAPRQARIAAWRPRDGLAFPRAARLVPPLRRCVAQGAARERDAPRRSPPNSAVARVRAPRICLTLDRAGSRALRRSAGRPTPSAADASTLRRARSHGRSSGLGNIFP